MKIGAFANTHNYRNRRSKFASLYVGQKGSILMRSGWETKYALWLDRQRIDWRYEPTVFFMGRTAYLPDFYLPNHKLYVEIKGRLTQKAFAKMRLFQRLYPREKLVMLRFEDLKSLGVL